MKVASHSFNIGDIVEIDKKTFLITHKIAEVSYYVTCVQTGLKIIVTHKLDKIKKVS